MSHQAWSVREAALEELARGHALLPVDATPAEGETWLLLEDAQQGLLACLRVRAGIGLQEPRAWFHLGCVVHAAKPLQLFQRRTTLQLGNDHTGASELADIAWHREGMDEPTQAELLRVLIDAALRRLKSERALHGDRLIVELPGLRDEQGQAPFWLGLGKHFYGGDVAALAASHGPRWRSWVASLLPRQPVYACLLPAAAQAAIGQVNADARVLAGVLDGLGFSSDGHIGIADGGPVFVAAVDRLLAPC